MQGRTPSDLPDNYGYLIRRVLSLSLPMAWSRFIQMIGWFVGMLMIAHLGKADLAASALINSAQITVTVLFMSLFFATGVIAGRLYGEGKPQEMGALFQQACLLGIFVGIITMVILFYVSRILIVADQPPELVTIVEKYFHGLVWVGIPLMLLIAIQQFCYGIMQQNLVIYNNMIALVLFIPLTYVFIYGGLGIKPMGVIGLAYGIVVQTVFNLVLLIGSLCYTEAVKKFRLFGSHNHHGLRYIKQLFLIGWPMTVQFGGELLWFFIMTLFTGWISIAALSSSQITIQVAILFLVPLFAVSESAGILVSQSIGAKRLDEVNRIANVSLIFGVILVVICSILFFAIPDYLTAMYIDIHDPGNRATVILSRWLFYISSLMLLTDLLRNLYTGALRGYYDTQFPMWVGLFVLWIIGLPLSYILGLWLNGGVIGIRVGSIVGIAIGSLILWRRWHYKVTQSQKISAVEEKST